VRSPTVEASGGGGEPAVDDGEEVRRGGGGVALAVGGERGWRVKEEEGGAVSRGGR
jgi:hypothetical protein